MRKAEFRAKAEKYTRPAYWNKSVTNHGFVIYKAMQYRWEDTADPEIDDVSYHLTQAEAEVAASRINLEVGFESHVDRVEIPYGNFNEGVGFGEDFDLNDLDDYRKFDTESETVWVGETNEGDDITGSVIVSWSYERYVGYARNLEQIGIAGQWPFHDFKHEVDLISGNEERTFYPNYSVLLTASEIKGLDSDEIESAIMEALNESRWKWNYFKKNPNSGHIRDSITEICDAV